jgi:hypothetical integral membrane protein (TIGR02206 family)
MNASDYFFKYLTEGIPKEIASGLFTPGHLTALFIVTFSIIILVLIFRNQSAKVRRIFIIICAFIIAASECVRMIWVVLRIGFTVSDTLPLNLCGLMMFFVPAAVITRRKLLMEFIYACGLAGASAALLTPDVSIYPVLHFQYIQSFISHGMIVFVPIFLIAAEGFRPDYKYIPKVLILLLSMLPFIYVLNLISGSNFFFLMYAPPGTLIEIYYNIAGYPGYIILLVFTMVVLWTILYLPWVIHDRLMSSYKNKDEGLLQ